MSTARTGMADTPAHDPSRAVRVDAGDSAAGSVETGPAAAGYGVPAVLDMAVSRFNAFSRLQRELADARSALEERKLVERAKGILMKMRGLSEEEAFALLRQSAMNEKKKMADIAQSIVTAARLLL